MAANVEWVWQQQSVWSQAANRLKSRIGRARWAILGLTITIAASSLASSQLISVSRPAGVTLSVIAAVCAVGLGAVASAQDKDRIGRWTQARSVSEALKSEVYLYLAGCGPYGEADRDQRLTAEAQRIIDNASELAAVMQPLTPTARAIPAVQDVGTYLSVRVRTSQLDNYYRPNARRLARLLRNAKIATVVLSLLAAALGALAVVSADLAAWAAVVTAAVGAAGAYVAGERWEFLVAEYSRTAQELNRLLTLQTAPDGSPLSPADLVARCEEVISVQNQAWMTKWGSAAVE
jgi:small-conductance mechanosensitive channel